MKAFVEHCWDEGISRDEKVVGAARKGYDLRERFGRCPHGPRRQLVWLTPLAAALTNSMRCGSRTSASAASALALALTAYERRRRSATVAAAAHRGVRRGLCVGADASAVQGRSRQQGSRAASASAGVGRMGRPRCRAAPRPVKSSSLQPESWDPGGARWEAPTLVSILVGLRRACARVL